MSSKESADYVVVKDDKYFNPLIEVMKGKVGA